MLEGCTEFPAEFSDRYIREGYWKAETIAEALVASARRHPDSIAVVDPNRSLTFRELIEEAAGLASIIERSGLRRGDRIVIQLPNCAEFASLFIACMETGVIPVLALPALRRAELEYLISFSGARAIGDCAGISRLQSRGSGARTGE